MNTDTLVLFLIFQNMFHYFWMITWMKKVLLSICLFFAKFSLVLFIKKVLLIKKECTRTVKTISYILQKSSVNFH